MKVIKPSVKIIRPNLNDPAVIDEIYSTIQFAGRICYKSKNAKVAELEEKIENLHAEKNKTKEYSKEFVNLARELNQIKKESARKFIVDALSRKHESIIEHISITFCMIVDRGVSHEIVRHRLASYTQESTRYCSYDKDKFGNEITVIEPVFYKDIPQERKEAIENMFNTTHDSSSELLNSLSPIEKRYADWWYACHVAEQTYLEMMHFGATAEEARDVLPTSTKTEIVITMNLRELRHFLSLRAAGTTGKPHPQMAEVAVILLEELKEKMPEIFGDI